MLPRLVVPLTPKLPDQRLAPRIHRHPQPPIPRISRKNLRTPSIPPCNSTRSHRNPSPQPRRPAEKLDTSPAKVDTFPSKLNTFGQKLDTIGPTD